MVLRYIAPTEDAVESIFPAGHGPAVLLLVSSGIPALYRLATADGVRMTVADFERDQLFLLYLFARAAMERQLEEFRALVAGQGICRENDLLVVAARQTRFATPEVIGEVLTTYRDKMAATGATQHMSCWYRWLTPENYVRLRRALLTDSLGIRFGELTSVLIFEPDGRYDFIDLSNCREWSYRRTHVSLFSGAELYGGFADSFCDWDRKLADLCAQKTNMGAMIRTTLHPEEPGGATPHLEQCPYWSARFSLIARDERVVPYNYDGRSGPMVASFYRKNS